MSNKQQLKRAHPLPKEWREIISELADDLAIELDMRYQSRHQYPSEQRKYENEMAVVNKARALLAKEQP